MDNITKTQNKFTLYKLLCVLHVYESWEINPLLLHYQRPIHDTGVDAHNIFAQKADKGQLYRAKEENSDEDRRRAQRELIPPDQFGN